MMVLSAIHVVHPFPHKQFILASDPNAPMKDSKPERDGFFGCPLHGIPMHHGQFALTNLSTRTPPYIRVIFAKGMNENPSTHTHELLKKLNHDV